MEVCALGCNGPFPGANGAGSGYLISSGDTKILMDCGPGVLGRLMALYDPARLTAVLLSHSHADHCSDLMALRYYLEIRRQTTPIAPLSVYAPKDEASPVLTFLAASDVFDLHWVKPGDVLSVGHTEVVCTPARHPVPAVGYRMGSFAYTGDTNTLDGLDKAYQGVSLLLADGCLLTSMWKEAAPHMSAFHAAELARDAGAGRLILTHLRPDVDEKTLLKEAQSVFAETALIKPGEWMPVADQT